MNSVIFNQYNKRNLFMKSSLFILTLVFFSISFNSCTAPTQVSRVIDTVVEKDTVFYVNPNDTNTRSISGAFSSLPVDTDWYNNGMYYVTVRFKPNNAISADVYVYGYINTVGMVPFESLGFLFLQIQMDFKQGFIRLPYYHTLNDCTYYIVFNY